MMKSWIECWPVLCVAMAACATPDSEAVAGPQSSEAALGERKEFAFDNTPSLPINSKAAKSMDLEFLAPAGTALQITLTRGADVAGGGGGVKSVKIPGLQLAAGDALTAQIQVVGSGGKLTPYVGSYKLVSTEAQTPYVRELTRGTLIGAPADSDADARASASREYASWVASVNGSDGFYRRSRFVRNEYTGFKSSAPIPWTGSLANVHQYEIAVETLVAYPATRASKVRAALHDGEGVYGDNDATKALALFSWSKRCLDNLIEKTSSERAFGTLVSAVCDRPAFDTDPAERGDLAEQEDGSFSYGSHVTIRSFRD